MQIHRVSIDCRVIGVVELTGGPFGGPGGDILMPLARAASIQAENVANVQSFLRADRRANSYTSVTVKVSRPDATQTVAERIKALGYSTISLADALQGIRWVFIILNSILGLIGSIALIVSSLGIVNTMVMSILERTREIGIMKAVGASDGDIRRIFLVEASVIGLMGGASGLFLGWLIGRAINLGANLYIESQGGPSVTLFSLPWWLITGALLFSIAVSVVAGSYPANRAARLEPMSALRHD
jgi:putative ABC transport system permease protein